MQAWCILKKRSGYSAAWFSAFVWGTKGREFESRYPNHFFCSLQSSPLWLDFFMPRFYPKNHNHLQQYHRPDREQTENAKFSVFQCVLNRSSQNSLFGQVAGPFQEIISQPHREQHFTETHRKITENSLFFSILYFPTWTFTPSKNAIQRLLFLPQLVDNDHKSKGLFFRNKRHRHLVNALEIFSVFFCFFWSKYATSQVSESKKAAGSLMPPNAATASLYAKHLLLILP